jgi:uncharacterized membrane protein YoaK (UPF0700 family)
MDEVGRGAVVRALPASATSRRDLILIAMTFVAGCVDGISYLGLDRVLTANMTGNAVLLGLAIGQTRGLRVLNSAVALAGFGLGVAFGARLVDPGRDRLVWSPRLTRTLAVELALLAAFSAVWWASGPKPLGLAHAGLIALSSMAMGVQSAAARRCAVSGVSTTYITGTLTGLMADLAVLGVASVNWGRSAAVLTALIAGAALGALTQARFPMAAPIVPAILLGALVTLASVAFRANPDSTA